MTASQDIVKEVRQFNRFYTGLVGLLDQHILDSDFSLSEVRVLYEIWHSESCTAGKLVETLGIDGGYLSRMLKAFEKNRLIVRRRSPADARTRFLQLSAKGKKLMEALDERSSGQVRELLKPLPEGQQQAVAGAMKTIQHILSGNNTLQPNQVVFRYHLEPGDVGYLIYLHGLLYARESNYNLEFEGYVCKTFYEFLQTYNPSKDRVFLATYGGKIIGAVAILGHSKHTAQLRWLLVHPDFRGMGLGKKLLHDAIAFSREKRYQQLYLLTTNVQARAIEMYTKAGFRKTGEKLLHQWGQHLYEERYDMELEQQA